MALIKCEQTTDLKALQDAYCELWQAVENGIKSNEEFFRLRETYRKLMMIEPKVKNKKGGK